MNNKSDRFYSVGKTLGAVDAGLRSHMIATYNYMGLGLALTGLVSYLVSTSTELLNLVAVSGFKFVPLFACLGIVFFLSARIGTMATSTAQSLFWVFSALMGLSLAPIFIIYTHQSIARVFFVSSSMFLGMSLWGYTTKKDLTSMGSFLSMGVIGIVIASFVNLFLQSSALQFACSVLGVVIFSGLTAYDTQVIKEMYYEADSKEVAAKKAIHGALTLYLDFINLFLSLLRLFGDRK